ncbi:hypothetical protein J1G43_17965 [Cellulomonas sp. zg-ZUI22]|uniref:nucleotidyltransferase domain-containing protein n=1 Tax=Cellulomonas sp. zg-ZUI22 TaxID=2816955 RepID=UPI001A9535F4|nr:hypothetical protein [Cellulomonas sp. zg-ZUI22]MBO0901851.1 hypothetical protein [Cellulomonas sp. zg-ZUI22]
MTTSASPTDPWNPLTPAAVAARFDPTGVVWMIAGGVAIDLFVERRTRPHGDVDVVLLRRDQAAVHQAVPGWQVCAADPPGHLRPWPPGEVLPVTVHDIWCRSDPAGPWQVQVMLDESDGDEWVSRRDPGLRRPLAGIRRTTATGLPYLAPEVQLYYKAKAPRPKDVADLESALPHLTDEQRTWLHGAVSRVSPEHAWLGRLGRRDAPPAPR